MFTKTFKELGLSSITQQVFCDLLEKGASSARQLSDRLSIPRPSVYDNLKILIQNGLVTERDEENKKIFSIDDINNIPSLLQEKIAVLQNEKKTMEQLLPSLLQKVDFVEPKIRFYSGTEGVKQAMNHIMLNWDIETIIMWPMSEMMELLGKEYLEELNKKRIKRNISIRGIYPADKKLNYKDYPFLGVGSGHLREIRIAPKNMTWNMGFWMYEDKVAFLSSRKEMFSFVIHSKDFADLMRTEFNEIWKISKPVKSDPQNTDIFLKSIGTE